MIMKKCRPWHARFSSLNFGFLISLFFSILLAPALGNAGYTSEVRGLRYWSTPDYIRVVVDLSKPAEFTKGRLSNPERLFFDFKNTRLMAGLPKNYPVKDNFLEGIRMGQLDANTARIVFDLRLKNYDFRIFSLEHPARFVIDIFMEMHSEKRPTTKTDTKEEKSLAQRVIVLDPGHGGHDPGAVGPSGLYERDVVLDIALRARNIIEKRHPSYKVILTRNTDTFIPLNKRAAIANDNNADIFVSIHTNAYYDSRVRGIETFVLNWTSDVGAMRVAARENNISLAEMRRIQGELKFILMSLKSEGRRNESIMLAGNIQNSLVSSINSRHPTIYDRGVRQAMFFVLIGAEMPSALVEVGFISNPETERLLMKEAYREKMACSIVSGIHSYLSADFPVKVVHY